MTIITKTIPLSRLISYSLNIDIRNENGDWTLSYTNPEDTDTYRIRLDTASENLLKQKRTQMLAFINQDITLSGTITEHWQKQLTTKTTTIDEWVQVAS